ncbi:MAG TPA: hypothetical protein DCG33_05010 [Prevotellaceae bacterium]|nr:hypothetical protein [Prevotellaceae bacterium]
MRRLYHGSNVKIEVPDLTHSKPFKDFGRGFYLSPNKQQAWDMAFQKINQTKEGKAEVTEFLFDETAMVSGDLKVLSFPDYCEEWASFVLANRDKQRQHPIHDYDIVYGPIADDGVTYQLRRYEGGVISLPRLVEELKYAKGITFQYFFGTQRALQLLKKL